MAIGDRIRNLLPRTRTSLGDKISTEPILAGEIDDMSLERATALFRQHSFEAAEVCVREAIARRGENAARLLLLGKILREKGDAKGALSVLDRAAKQDPDDVAILLYQGLCRLDSRDPIAAAKIFDEATRRAPDIGEHHRLLGVAFRRANDFDGALHAFEAAARCAPKDPAAIVDLAAIREEIGQIDAALLTLEGGLAEIGPHRLLVEAAIRALRRRGRHRDAVAWIARLLADNPDVSWLHGQMALTLEGFDRPRANAYFTRARQLNPTDTRLLVAHADSLNRTRGPDEAENIARAYRLGLERLAISEDLRQDTRVLLGIFVRNADFGALARLGCFEDIGRHYAANGQYAALHLLLAQARTPQHRRLLLEWHRNCGDLMISAAQRAPLTRPVAPAVIGGAKIRVGLMSSDLRDHPIGHFAQPLARHYDRDRFEFYAYSWSTRDADAMQTAFTRQFDQFRHQAPISNRAAAQLIADDRLDVLFDLGGSTDMNKLETLAWRPAPRIASWLAYPHSAGLETIDRILVDPYLQPPDPSLLIEKPLRLAHSWVAMEWDARDGDHAIALKTPNQRAGRLTFGTMNNPCKYNPELIATWAAILRRTPGSRFLFVRPEGAVESFRTNIISLFESHDVTRERVFFVPIRGRHLPHYNEIDISLDTFPQTGGTTTCESLWMGTPVISLVGEAFFERLSYSNLSNAGLGELAVFDRDAYVEKAVAVAHAEDWRLELRRTIRERLKAHPLGDGPAFVHDFQEAVTSWMEEQRP